MGAYDCDCINNLEYDRRERKAQHSREGTTKDIISRQAVLDAVEKNACNTQRIIDAVNNLPPAQPEPTDIDAREAVYNLAEKIGIHQLFALTVELRGEPIQPEPHEGHWINGKCDLCGEHAPFWCMASTYYESNYCPNCGAYMKGAEHETD